MELEEIRTFIFESESLAEDAYIKINAKFGKIATIGQKNKKKVCTVQPESLTDMVVEFVENELGGKMKGFSLTWT